MYKSQVSNQDTCYFWRHLETKGRLGDPQSPGTLKPEEQERAALTTGWKKVNQLLSLLLSDGSWRYFFLDSYCLWLYLVDMNNLWLQGSLYAVSIILSRYLHIVSLLVARFLSHHNTEGICFLCTSLPSR